MEDKKKRSHISSNLNSILKGQRAFYGTQGFKYIVKYKPSPRSCAVSIIDSTLKGKNNWVIRFDRPHKGVDFSHININSKISGIKDPHIPLPPGGLAGVEGVTKVTNILNKVALPIAIALDVGQTSFAVYDDYKKKTSRNTVEAIAKTAGGWGGGYAGAAGLAAVGTAILPGVATIVGGIVGGVAGGICGSLGLGAATNAIADKAAYDIAIIECNQCQEKFEWRKYLDEDPECPKCRVVIVQCQRCDAEFEWKEYLGNYPECPKCKTIMVECEQCQEKFEWKKCLDEHIECPKCKLVGYK